VTNAFNEEVVKTMAAHVSRPIIMPLSNPTPLSEAHPRDLLEWTQGKAIIATGSPFPDVAFNHQFYPIAQSNNALAFPGIGLGVVATKAKRVSSGMLWAATNALSACSPMVHDPLATLLPKLSHAKNVSYQVALAVAEQAQQEGLVTSFAQSDLTEHIKSIMWEPQYYPYKYTR
jgi:malate dehydrogenase (oxaloacetate-decarboxylating)